ncbi:2Fe-2S iron-sulfur cluster binding domain-containing protein [Pontibacillus yanchengensis]|uniref:2Fe-2S iron-sulfur cluster binding domain-containing protein n=3 Tax=Pontibacillus yanchengensis TaxID=462910 RepID=A0ACC7VG86_9BACI|nr:2Fe-2S iron-sulfur cluster binding domain-containing protein [Pontibacillus yanchengensis]MYL53610.1 2Fe-2S iron-sulfur cluster binding domain-containing protein [Pontibacillus yanchengensis]
MHTIGEGYYTYIMKGREYMNNEQTIQVKQYEELYSIQAVKGQSLLASAFEQEVPLDFKCQKGNCTRCRVELLDGDDIVNNPTPKEHEKLEEELEQGYRLACQTVPLK